MNATFKGLSTAIFLLFSLSQVYSFGGEGEGSQEATVLFSLEQCVSIIPGETSRDYSEFTADITQQSFADISVVGEHLYRNDGRANPHSCTPGVLEGTQGMCVSSRRTCDYQPLTNKSVNFDIRVVPLTEEPVRLTQLNFYELAPEMYTFINGGSGENGYPTLYGVRVLRDGREIFRSTENPTTRGWSLESFEFEDN